MMSVRYSVYGLGVRVNVPIAGLASLPPHARVDVEISLGEMPPELAGLPDGHAREFYVSPYRDEDGQPTLRVARLIKDKYFRINYSDETVIVIDAQGTRIWATWPESATVEDTATYLLGPALGFLLRLRGVTCLHASAVVIDSHAIALVGPSGYGKSSTAAAFAQSGYPVLSDDVVALHAQGNQYYAQPAYPRLRLWPSSASSLFGSVDALPHITPGWEKRYLDLNNPGYRFQFEPMPLAAVYLLGERTSSERLSGVEAVSPRDGLMTLISDTYTNYLLDRKQRALEFQFLASMLERVPIRKVTPSTDFARIRELCEVIAEDAHGLTASAAI